VENTKFPEDHFERLQEMFASSAKDPLIYGGIKKSEYNLLLTPKHESKEFKIPQPTNKEKVARQLGDQAKKSLSQKTPFTPSTPMPQASSFPQQQQRRRRLEDFSPAAQRFIASSTPLPSFQTPKQFKSSTTTIAKKKQRKE
jgi:hypothetical protein